MKRQAWIGHDIRNPLQTITSSVFLAKQEIKNLKDDDAKTNIEDSLNQIEQQTEYIDKIVLDLQDYARTLCPEIKEAKILTILSQVIPMVNIPENIELTSLVPENLPKVKTDVLYLKRTLANLINNSVQAMPKGGKITVTASCKDGKLALNVSDTGEGIPKEIRDKIFKPLFTTKSKGQGFGLAVCKRLMEAQNSSITFESEPGKGTTFTIQLQQNKMLTTEKTY